MTVSRRRVVVVAPVLAAMLALPGCDRVAATWDRIAKPAGPTFHATDITGADFAKKLELPDVDGKPRTLADWKGKVTIVLFGYTQCPDGCPATMAEVAEVRKMLGADAARLQAVFITVDPERDSAPILKAYVGNFGDDVVALRGTLEQTLATAKEFKVYYAKAPSKAPGAYTMDHTAASFVFDPTGRVRLYVPYGGDPKNLASDIKQLLAS